MCVFDIGYRVQWAYLYQFPLLYRNTVYLSVSRFKVYVFLQEVNDERHINEKTKRRIGKPGAIVFQISIKIRV